MKSEEIISSCLEFLDPRLVSYQEWIVIGAALKNEGFSVCVWDEWSKKDEKRYDKNAILRKWNSFTKKGATGATIVYYAKQHGWRKNDGLDEKSLAPGIMTATQQLHTYLETLFAPEEHIGFVTKDVFLNKNGKYSPRIGEYKITCGDLLKSLEMNPEYIERTVGCWKGECGAWIRFNPLDGNGITDCNVTRFKHALVESDEMPLKDQIAMIRILKLPVSCLVYSGGKSVHAIVKVDAQNIEEYKARVNLLYKFLSSQGLFVDNANKNPSRLSRMPGVIRNNKFQTLLAVNIGCKSWDEWVMYVSSLMHMSLYEFNTCTF